MTPCASNTCDAVALPTSVASCRVWSVIRMKDAVLDIWLQAQRKAMGSGQTADMQRALLPLSSLATWFATFGALVHCLSLAGINVQPILGFGGVSAAVVGLSGQSVLANLIAGINLFVSRPCASLNSSPAAMQTQLNLCSVRTSSLVVCQMRWLTPGFPGCSSLRLVAPGRDHAQVTSSNTHTSRSVDTAPTSAALNSQHVPLRQVSQVAPGAAKVHLDMSSR